jgi:ankyrin repeat protein
MFAAMFAKNDLLKLLIAKGADPALADIRGQRASELAPLHENTD